MNTKSAVLLALSALPAYSTSIQITEGTVVFSSQTTTNIACSQLSVTGLQSMDPFAPAQLFAGGTIELFLQTTWAPFYDNGGGRMAYNGYDGFSRAHLFLAVAPFLFSTDARADTVVSRPFVLSGTVEECIPAKIGGLIMCDPNPPDPMLELTGHGHMDYSFQYTTTYFPRSGDPGPPADLYLLSGITAVFEPGPAHMPEPGTWLMLAGGLAAFGALRWRLRKPAICTTR